jgi:hypothetical protein
MNFGEAIQDDEAVQPLDRGRGQGISNKLLE